MSKIQAVVFDFDGVILDSANIKTEAFLELFKEYPHHKKAIKEYHIENQGITRYKKFEWIYRTLLNKPYDDEIREKLGLKFSELVFEKIMTAEPIPGAIELLNRLFPHVPAFVASGTPDDELKMILEKRELAGYFKAVYGSKTEKEIAIDLISEDELIDYSQMLFVGDAITDFKAAKARGVPFAAVYSESMENFWRSENIVPVKNVMELYRIIDEDASL